GPAVIAGPPAGVLPGPPTTSVGPTPVTVVGSTPVKPAKPPVTPSSPGTGWDSDLVLLIDIDTGTLIDPVGVQQMIKEKLLTEAEQKQLQTMLKIKQAQNQNESEQYEIRSDLLQDLENKAFVVEVVGFLAGGIAGVAKWFGGAAVKELAVGGAISMSAKYGGKAVSPYGPDIVSPTPPSLR
ncbi:MAG: hypothetical protein O2912_07000, partial [Proteobacteria bacterium]|nr:hypothetical protein [Pseudomonadota bacterium]